jgi:hypothetical protein
MKRFSTKAKSHRRESLDVDKFLEEVLLVCRKHGMTISHEDHGGAFKVEGPSEFNLDWLWNAYDERELN